MRTNTDENIERMNREFARQERTEFAMAIAAVIFSGLMIWWLIAVASTLTY